MNKILLSTLICLLLFTGMVFGQDSFIFGFKPASPDSITAFKSDLRKPFVNGFKHCTFKVQIDKKGKVKKISSEDPGDSLFTSFVASYIKSLDFQPATENGKPVSSSLAVRFDFSSTIAIPDVTFPLDPHAVVASPSLLVKTYTYNAFEYPVITMFPSYFSDIKPTDSSYTYPFVVFKIDLDKKGDIIDREIIRPTGSTFDSQIGSAILYANFEPAKKKGKDIESSVYFMTSFFPQISYPSSIYRYTDSDSVSNIQKKRVQICNYTDGILMGPLPKRIPDYLYSKTILEGGGIVGEEAYISIDTTGHARVLRVSTKRKNIIKSFRNLVKKLIFYPAIDIHGKTREFNGYIRIVPSNDEVNIRISYLWLK